MNRKLIFLLAVILGFMLNGCGGKDVNSSGEKVVLKIATASNMQLAMDSIVKIFLKTTGIECVTTSNSSGMLTAQIQNGAPFDVFVAANVIYPNELIKSGFGDRTQIYATGRLVLVYPKGKRMMSPEEVLTNPAIRRIAIADGRTAPYGIAANEYLDKSGIRSEIEKKIVVGESVGQVNQYIQTGAVDAAFTCHSFVRKFSDHNQYLEIDKRFYSEIQQGVIILKSGKENHPEEAKRFVDFLFSDECQKVLAYFGYEKTVQ